MQIASPQFHDAGHVLARPSSVTDAVSPSKLFDIARTRFEVALITLGVGGKGTTPTALVASTAIKQAEAGIATLQSILVPSTPYELRSRAAHVMDAARAASMLLYAYRRDVVALGDGPIDVGAVSDATRLTLTSAKSHLQHAIGTLR